MADTANGMGGLVVPAVFAALPFDLEVMYGELDGTFPNHPADPIQPENHGRPAQRGCVEVGADVGLAFDGDADRVFLVDEHGEGLSGSTTTAILADAHPAPERRREGRAQPHLLEGRARGDPRGRRRRRSAAGSATASSSRSWPRPARSSAASTRRTTTSRDNYRADSGPHRGACSCSSSCACAACRSRELRKPYERYAASGEINTTVDDPLAVIERVAEAFAGAPAGPPRRPHRRRRATGGSTSASNTEPLLRLNLEAPHARASAPTRVESVALAFT